MNAEWAVSETTADLMARFRSLPDENFAHRADDIDDVARVLKKHLGGEENSRLRMEDLAGEAIVLVADELTPSDAVRIPRDRVVGFVTERGGRTSHAAILARSFGIPAVVGVPQLLAEVGEGDRVVVDGRDGIVWREPSEDVIGFFRDRRDQEARHERSLKERSHGGITRTRDGAEVIVRANIELASEIDDVIEYGADGVGLFRSEFLYLSKEGDRVPVRGGAGGRLPRGHPAARAAPRRDPHVRPRREEGGPSSDRLRRIEPGPRPSGRAALLRAARDVLDAAACAARRRRRGATCASSSRWSRGSKRSDACGLS